MSHPAATLGTVFAGGLEPCLHPHLWLEGDVVSFPLMCVATEASRRGVPTLLVAGRMVSVGDPVLRSLPLLGTRFASSVDAVASRIGFGGPGSPPPILAVDRDGEAVLFDPLLDVPYDVGAEPSIALDAAWRALGLQTPAPDRSVAEYLDAVWLDRILDLTLDAPLGEPPAWAVAASLHPSAPPRSGLMSPEHLVHHRRGDAVGWADFREAVIERRTGWPPITAGLAAWFDEGSFCRHLMAQLPEPSVVLDELAELLAPADFASIADVCAA